MENRLSDFSANASLNPHDQFKDRRYWHYFRLC